MTVQFIRLASQGLPVGAIRILPPATEAALVADGEAIYTTVPNPAGDDLPVRFDPTTGMIVMSDGGPIAAQVALQGVVSGGGIYNPVVGQTGIPMFLQSSGSVADNGALSGLTPLPAVYSSCYMYFIAGAVYAGSPAGMYYVVLSGNTAGTIYGNVYTGGTPTIPATPTPIVAAGPGAYTQTTATSLEVLSFTVAAGAMGPNGRLEIRGRMSCPNNANIKSLVGTFGDASPMTWCNNGVTANLGVEFGNTIANRGAEGVQVGNAPSFGTLGQTGTAALRGTVDTTVAQTVRFRLAIAVATDYALIEHASVDVFPA